MGEKIENDREMAGREKEHWRETERKHRCVYRGVMHEDKGEGVFDSEKCRERRVKTRKQNQREWEEK